MVRRLVTSLMTSHDLRHTPDVIDFKVVTF